MYGGPIKFAVTCFSTCLLNSSFWESSNDILNFPFSDFLGYVSFLSRQTKILNSGNLHFDIHLKATPEDTNTVRFLKNIKSANDPSYFNNIFGQTMLLYNYH